MKYIFAFSILLLACFKGLAQIPNFEVKINEINSETVNIQIVISENNLIKDISIWDKEPWNGGTKIEAVENIETSDYEFHNLKKENYIIIVTDINGNSRIKPLNLLNNNYQTN